MSRPRANKLSFAPLPPRAIADARLSALDLRTLACVCFHDRMSKPRNVGQGCWASNKTLAEEIGCDYTRLSTTITRLGQFGYIERKVHPLNKRLRIYVVLYDDTSTIKSKSGLQAALDSLPIGKVSTTPNSLLNGKVSDERSEETVCEPADEMGPIVCRHNSQTPEDVEQSSVNIFRETDNKSCLSAERNSPPRRSADEGSEVDRIEQAFLVAAKSNSLSTAQLEQWQRDLGSAYLNGSPSDPATDQAYRVMMEVENEISARTGINLIPRSGQ